MAKRDIRRWFQYGLKELFIFTAIVAIGMKLYVPGHSVTHYAPLVEGTRPGQAWSGNGLGMQFRWCPAGEFMMGSPAEEEGRFDNEAQVKVTISRGFWLGKCEVTQAEWKRVMGSEPWKGDRFVKEGDYFPATLVSHDDATKFCKEFTKQERAAGRLPKGWEYRLPTEAQWEYACRAGSQTRFCFGDDEKKLGEYAWFDEKAWDANDRFAHAVGLKRPNAWGLRDMHGNVWEWCRDWYDDPLPGGTDPEVAKQATFRVFRSGCWVGSARDCRSAVRSWVTPGLRVSLLGFRLAPVRVSE